RRQQAAGGKGPRSEGPSIGRRAGTDCGYAGQCGGADGASGCDQSSGLFFFLVSLFGRAGTVNQEPEGGGDGEPREPVAPAGVDGDVVAETVGSDEDGAAVGRQRGDDAAVGIDGNGEAGVGGAEEPAAIFDGADARHRQMLLERGRLAEPAVVG